MPRNLQIKSCLFNVNRSSLIGLCSFNYRDILADGLEFISAHLKLKKNYFQELLIKQYGDDDWANDLTFSSDIFLITLHALRIPK